ncbi:amidohydrolase family protein [Solihabitans fulvus]|uniref:Amidohydrolase family protein n=1 Tax=Solihabitans fulvus TaxID=1892852 RepID=A0A5B2X874_9PSEU|nr:amidohydrolase family protein [Solihabitans fulvus]KAA2259474.1 amidohydrolase family protein [Solihabitans fulvus]
MSTLIVRNGWVIDVEPEPTVRRNIDISISDGRIVAVGPNLPADDAEVIDATGHLVLPGFVDTHRHLWQTTLRSSAVDVDLRQYLDRTHGVAGPLIRPEDVHAGNLVGALECLDSGITTVQDHSHVQFSPAHSDAAITALADAGIRAVFGYGYPVLDAAARRPAEVRRVREQYFASGDQLLTLRLAPAGPSYSPVDTVREDWALARELGLGIAVHVGSGPVAERPVDTLRRHGLLRADTLYVHGNSLPDNELQLIADSGGAVSIAPAIEAQMGHGAPMIGRLRRAGITTGLGVDVVTSTAGDMFSLMRAALLSSHLGEGPRLTAAEILQLATIDGATALGLADRIGSLQPGKQADLVLLHADAPNLAGATHDPIGAVVTAAHPGNVSTVLVAGTPVKQAGRLQHPALHAKIAEVHQSAHRLATQIAATTTT